MIGITAEEKLLLSHSVSLFISVSLSDSLHLLEEWQTWWELMIIIILLFLFLFFFIVG